MKNTIITIFVGLLFMVAVGERCHREYQVSIAIAERDVAIKRLSRYIPTFTTPELARFCLLRTKAGRELTDKEIAKYLPKMVHSKN